MLEQKTFLAIVIVLHLCNVLVFVTPNSNLVFDLYASHKASLC